MDTPWFTKQPPNCGTLGLYPVFFLFPRLCYVKHFYVKITWGDWKSTNMESDWLVKTHLCSLSPTNWKSLQKFYLGGGVWTLPEQWGQGLVGKRQATHRDMQMEIGATDNKLPRLYITSSSPGLSKSSSLWSRYMKGLFLLWLNTLNPGPELGNI